MYQGYFTYGGIEIINMARLAAYRDNGVVPPGVTVYDCVEPCPDLPLALGQPGYRTPLLDRPPWYDVTNPASEQFAGIIPIEMTGLEGATRTAEMVDAIGGGAKPARPVYGPRTIGVTGLLLGSTSAGVQAGLTWLNSALDQNCAGWSCEGFDLAGLTQCPPIATNNVDMEQPMRLQRRLVDFTQFTANGITAPIGPEVLRNWAANPSAEYGLSGLSEPTFLDAAGNLQTLPTESLTRVPVTTPNPLYSGDWLFHLDVPPSPAAGPIYEVHWLAPVTSEYGGPASVRFVDQGSGSTAMWRVLDDPNRVRDGGLETLLDAPPPLSANEWTWDPAVSQVTGPEIGDLPAAEGTGYAHLTVVSAYVDPDQEDPPTTVPLLTQRIPLPAQMPPTFRVDAIGRINLPGGGTALLRVSRIPGREGAVGEITDPDPAVWQRVPVPEADDFITPPDPNAPSTDWAVYVTVEVPAGTPPGTVVNVDDVQVRLVYLQSTVTAPTETPTERVLEYVQPPETTVRLSVTAGTDESGATMGVYEWDAVRWASGLWWSPDEIPTDVLGGMGDFEADPGWANSWISFGGSTISPARDTVHARQPDGTDAPGQGGSLRVQSGTGTGLGRFATADLTALIPDPGTYTLRAYLWVPSFVPGGPTPGMGLAVFQGDTSLGSDATTIKERWAPVTFTFTIPEPPPPVDPEAPLPPPEPIGLFAVTAGGASTLALMWIDDLQIVTGPTFPEVQIEPSAYFDGDTPATDTGVFFWDGVPGNSQSVWRERVPGWWSLDGEQATVTGRDVPAVCDDVRVVWRVEVGDQVPAPEVVNLCTNPSFETGNHDWSGPGNTPSTTAGAVAGVQALHLDPNRTTDFGPWGWRTMPVRPNTTYTFSVYLITTDYQGVWWRLMLETMERIQITTPTPASNSWTRMSVTLTTGPFEATLAPQVVTGGNFTYLDAVLIEEGPAPTDYFDGDTPDTDVWKYEWTGPPHASASTKTRQVDTSAPPSGITVTPAALFQGRIYEVGATVPIEVEGDVRSRAIAVAAAANVQMVVHDPPGRFTPMLIIDGQPGTAFRVTSLEVYYRPRLAVADCLRDYWRTFPEVTTVAGPTVTDKIVFDCLGEEVECLQVEWTWVSGSAFRYGVDRTLISGLSASGGDQPVYRRPGIFVSNNGVLAAEPECQIFPTLPSCADNPCAPGFAQPPNPPRTITDPSNVSFETGNMVPAPWDPNVLIPETREVNDLVIGVPPTLIPGEQGGILTFTLTNDDRPKVGVMIRVYDDALPDYSPGFGTCLFAYEYRIDYIAPNAVMTLTARTGGKGQKIEAWCPGALRPDNAAGVVRGNYGGPVLESVARCARRYAIRVQWLDTYPNTCRLAAAETDVWVEGEDQGDLEVAVSLAVREA